jgi:hypothetical protein
MGGHRCQPAGGGGDTVYSTVTQGAAGEGVGWSCDRLRWIQPPQRAAATPPMSAADSQAYATYRSTAQLVLRVLWWGGLSAGQDR